MGRPTFYGEKMHPVLVRIPDDWREALDAIAKRDAVTTATVMRRMILSGIQRDAMFEEQRRIK
jgi:hypothetical protein